jgi:hypothetical protein
VFVEGVVEFKDNMAPASANRTTILSNQATFGMSVTTACPGPKHGMDVVAISLTTYRVQVDRAGRLRRVSIGIPMSDIRLSSPEFEKRRPSVT